MADSNDKFFGLLPWTDL